jgi:hypothetical protein
MQERGVRCAHPAFPCAIIDRYYFAKYTPNTTIRAQKPGAANTEFIEPMVFFIFLSFDMSCLYSIVDLVVRLSGSCTS